LKKNFSKKTAIFFLWQNRIFQLIAKSVLCWYEKSCLF